MSMIYRTDALAYTALPPNVPFPYGTHFAPPTNTPAITPEGWRIPIPNNPNALTDLMDIAPKTVELLAHPMWFDVTDKDGETRRLQFAEIETHYHTNYKAHEDNEVRGETIPVMIDPTSPMGYIPLAELKVDDKIIEALGEHTAPHQHILRTNRHYDCSAVAHVGHSVSVLDTFGHDCRCVFTPE